MNFKVTIGVRIELFQEVYAGKNGMSFAARLPTFRV